MNTKFANINLEVIDINLNATPDIYVNQNGITFSKRVLEDLNYPQNVQYCLDAENRIFAVRPCKTNEQKATPFSKGRGEHRGSTLSCNNKNLHEVLKKMVPDYDASKRYRVVGEFDAENRTIYYDMTTAEISMFRRADRATEE